MTEMNADLDPTIVPIQFPLTLVPPHVPEDVPHHVPTRTTHHYAPKKDPKIQDDQLAIHDWIFIFPTKLLDPTNSH